MKRKILLCVIFLNFMIFSASCVSINRSAGKNFNYFQISELTLNKTTKQESQALIGESSKIVKTKNIEGDFEKWEYMYGEGTSRDEAVSRILWIEFRNDQLNAYFYMSSFLEDSTAFDLVAYKNLKRNISTKEDVLKIMGKPSGRALYPSYYGEKAFPKKWKCEGAFECWVWSFIPKGKFGNTETVGNIAKVIFNEKGIVLEVESNLK